MGRILDTSRYEYDILPSLDDYLPGSDSDTPGLITKSYRIRDILSLVSGVVGDNLGDHTATQDLAMAGFDITSLNSIQFTPTDTEPVGATKGAIYYDTSESTLKQFDGTVWTSVGSPDLSNYVTLTGSQTITGLKTFTNQIILDKEGSHIRMKTPSVGGLTSGAGYNTLAAAPGGGIYYTIEDAFSVVRVIHQDYSNIFGGDKTFTWPNASGTVALTSDLSGYVTLSTSQTVSGQKAFSTSAIFNDHIRFAAIADPTLLTTTGGVGMDTSNQYFFQKVGSLNYAKFNLASLTADRVYTFPDATGTIALTSDLGNYVDKTSTENVGGLKTFTSSIHAGNGQIIFNDDATPSGYASGGAMGYVGASQFYFHQDHANVNNTWGIFDFANLTTARTFTLPNASGTVALTSNIPTVSDTAYDATSWNANTDAATKNAIRDKFESLPAYSEGTFTPTIYGATSGSGSPYTTSSASGEYIKIGKLVHFNIEFNGISGTTQTGTLTIGSLPFTKTNGGIESVYAVYLNIADSRSFINIVGRHQPNSTVISIFIIEDTLESSGMFEFTNVDFTSRVLTISGTYIATA